MDYFKELIKNYKLTKREKILLLIFLLLLMELFVYFFGFKTLKNKNLEYQNKIAKLSEENENIKLEIQNAEKLKNQNSKLLKLNLDINTYNNSLKDLKEEFPHIIEKDYLNSKNIDFEIDNKNINNLKNISNKNIYTSMVLNKKDSNVFVGKLDLKNLKNSLKLNKVEDKDKKNLEKYYFYKDKKDISEEKESAKEVKEVKKEPKVKIADNKKEEAKKKINPKKEEKDNLELNNKLKKDNNLDINLYSSNLEKSELSYIKDMDMYYLLFRLDDEIENIFLLEIPDILSFKELSFEIFIENDNLREFGIYDGRRIYSEIKLEKNLWNKIMFREVEDFRGIYFVYNTLNFSGKEDKLLIRDIRIEN